MKKYLVFTSFVVAMIVLPYISCKSNPPAEPSNPNPVEQTQSPAPQAPQTAAPNQALLGSLNEAAARAEEARKKAADFEGNLYFPSEWEAANAQYTQAGNVPKNSQTDIEKAIAGYNSATNSFDSIFKLTIPLYAQAREDEIMGIRDVLVDGRAKNYFPEYFDPADQAALLALEEYEDADYYSAKNTAAKSLLMYRTLEAAFYTWHLWWEINERDFIFYDPDDFNRANEIISDAMDAYLEKDFSAAQRSIREAEEKYGKVLEIGWASYADLRRSLAENERLTALDAKAHIGAKDYFNEADQSYQSALEYQNTEKYEDAAKQYVQAEAMYTIAGMSMSEKRRKAAAAIQDANEKIERSDEAAKRAAFLIYGEVK